MTTNMKITLGFLAGGAIGAGVTYILTKKHYEKILEEEISDMRAWLNSMEEGGEVKVNPVDEEDEEQKEYDDIRRSYGAIPQKPDLSSLVPKPSYKDNYPDGEPEPVEDEYFNKGEEEEAVESDEREMEWEREETQYEESLEPNPEGKPYLISRMDFIEEQGFDKDQLTYYAEDDTLIDSDGDIITEVEGMVGYDNLETMKDADLVYVRNERLMICYEIEILNRSYTQDVLGVEPETPKKGRTTRRRNQEEEE